MIAATSSFRPQHVLQALAADEEKAAPLFHNILAGNALDRTLQVLGYPVAGQLPRGLGPGAESEPSTAAAGGDTEPTVASTLDFRTTSFATASTTSRRTESKRALRPSVFDLGGARDESIHFVKLSEGDLDDGFFYSKARFNPCLLNSVQFSVITADLLDGSSASAAEAFARTASDLCAS